MPVIWVNESYLEVLEQNAEDWKAKTGISRSDVAKSVAKRILELKKENTFLTPPSDTESDVQTVSFIFFS
jgi:hypothetical protein